MKKQLLNLLRKPLFTLLALMTICASSFAQYPDSKGTDFWLAFPRNFSGGALSFFISSDVATSGTLTVPGGAYTQTFTTTPGVVSTLSIPSSFEVLTSDGIENKGIHIVSNDEIAVYGLNRLSATTDAYLGLPTDVLGTDYIVASYSGLNTSYPSAITVVGTQNATTLTITPTAVAGSRAANVPFTVNLNQGQTYQLRASASNGDLTGSLVKSDKPVSVFGSVVCANVPTTCTYCDHIVEELAPISSLGRSFISAPLATRSGGDIFRFIASEDNTIVTVNGTAQPSINKGQFREMLISTAANIESTKPILVVQYARGTSCDGAVGDPFMMVIPPYEQYINSYTINTPPTGFNTHWLNIVAPQTAIGNVTVDGTPIMAGSFAAVAGTSYVYARIEITAGTHTINSSFPIGVHVYGWGYADSYGYPGGQSFSPIGYINSITLSPASSSATIGTSSCVTATVLDQLAAPVAGARVDFYNGAVNLGFAYTNASGDATFCYTRTQPTTDNLTAKVINLVSNQVTKTWNCGQVNFEFTASNCEGDGNVGTITFTGVSGGVAPLYYSIDGGQNYATTASFTGLAVGQYSLIVQDAYGCVSNAQTANILTPECNGKLTTEVVNMSCPGGNSGQASVTVTGGVAPFRYLWSNGSTSSSISELTAGNYAVTVYAANCCTYTTSVTITAIDTVAPVIVCTQDIVVNAPENECNAVVNYELPTVTDNCLMCETINTIEGYANLGTFQGHTYFLSDASLDWPSANAAAQAIGGHLVSFADQAENDFVNSVINGQVYFTGLWQNHNNPNYSEPNGGWEWSDGTPLNFTNWAWGEPNDYYSTEDYMEIYGFAGGSWNDIFTWTTHQYIVEFDCIENKPVLLSGLESGSSFPAGTTTVTYQVKDASGNASTCSFNVTVATSPVVINSIVPKVYVGGKNISCKGLNDGEATVNVSGGCLPYTYSWSSTPAQTTATATALSSGTYTVTVTDGNGSSASSTVTLTEPAQLVVDAGNAQTVYYGYAPAECANVSGLATGGSTAYSYAWSDGATSAATTVCPSTTTNYTLTVTDANGCVASDDVTICSINVKCEYGGNALILGQGNKIVLCHKYDTKNQNTLCIDGLDVPNHLAHGDRLGACGINRSCVQQTMNKALGAENEETTSELEHNGIRVYPNPNAGSFNILIDSHETDMINITVTSITGTVVYQSVQQNQNKLAQIPVELNNCANGLYFLTVQIGDFITTEKIVVNK